MYIVMLSILGRQQIILHWFCFILSSFPYPNNEILPNIYNSASIDSPHFFTVFGPYLPASGNFWDHEPQSSWRRQPSRWWYKRYLKIDFRKVNTVPSQTINHKIDMKYAVRCMYIACITAWVKSTLHQIEEWRFK